MPDSRTRFVAGMAALACAFAVQACAALDAAPSPSPTGAASALPPTSPTPSPTGSAFGNWSESLDFAGDLGGHMSTVVANDTSRRSECTGKNSKTGGTWASTLYGDVGGKTFGVIFTISGYRGPGLYREGAGTVQVHSVGGDHDWQSRAGDALTVTVGNDEESGTVDANLTNLADGRSKLHLTGSWTCRTA